MREKNGKEIAKGKENNCERKKYSLLSKEIEKTNMRARKPNRFALFKARPNDDTLFDPRKKI